MVASVEMRNFHEIACSAGTDKCTRHAYGQYYEAHLEKRRNDSLVILEIGILMGASLRLWEEYFPNARIYGVDINPSFTQFASARSKVIIGDQADTSFLHRVANEASGFDIVVDDGGHKMMEQKTSFQTLFPYVRQGGLYVIEDMETSYYQDYGGGQVGTPGTAISMVKACIDDLNQEFHGAPATSPAKVSAIHSYKGIVFMLRG